MLKNSPLLRVARDLYVKFEASQLLAEQESQFDFRDYEGQIYHDNENIFVTSPTKLPILFLDKIF